MERYVPALKALQASAEGASPFDGYLLEYRNPVTAGPTLPSIQCAIQLLEPSRKMDAHRHEHDYLSCLFRHWNNFHRQPAVQLEKRRLLRCPVVVSPLPHQPLRLGERNPFFHERRAYSKSPGPLPGRAASSIAAGQAPTENSEKIPCPFLKN